jgi:alpha-beta hydrolase superfamily lysophospholipase
LKTEEVNVPFFDGQQERIYYREWDVERPVAGLLWLHGGGEHSGQYSRLASALNGRGINVWAPDHQGHGISGGAPHHSGGVSNIAADVTQLLGIVRSSWPTLPLVIGGHSLGGWTAALTIVRDAAPFAGAVIVGASLQSLTLDVAFESDEDNLYFDTSVLAADPGYLEELQKDPLVHLTIPKSAPVGSSLDDVVPVLAAGLPALDLPILLISGTKDLLAPIGVIRDWGSRIPGARQLEIVDGLHNVVNDVDHRQVSTAIGDFVVDVTGTRTTSAPNR